MLEGVVYGLCVRARIAWEPDEHAHYSIKHAPCTTASNAGTYEVVAMSGQPKPLWASELHPVGLHYYAGVVESAENLLEKHKVATQCSFGTRSSTSTKEAQNCDKENDPEPTVTAKVRLIFCR